jgi:TonB-dependent receptor
MTIHRILIAGLAAFSIQGAIAMGQSQPVSVEEGVNGTISEAGSSSVQEQLVSERERVQLVEDSSVAEAMDRRPDLNFSNVTIDGEKTTISLEDIPADQVESANVSKAVTPDLDADLRGGGLNLRSKPTYSLEKRVIKGSVLSEYNQVVEGWDTDANATYGRPMGWWGFIATASTRRGKRGGEEYGQDWFLEGSPGAAIPALKEQQLEYREFKHQHDSINATFDFKVSEAIRLYLKGDYRQSDHEFFLPRLTVRHDAGEYRNVTEEGADVDGGRLERSLIGFDSESFRYTLTTGGYLDFEKISVDYQLAYNYWNYLEPEWFAIRFLQEDVDLSYDLSRIKGPEFWIRPGSDADLNDPGAYLNDWVRTERWEEDNTDWVGTLNVRVPFQLSGVKGYFKTGLKLRGLDYFQDVDGVVYDSFDGTFTLDDVVGSYRNPDILNGFYDHGPFPSIPKSRQFLNSNRELFSLNGTRSREGSDPPSYNVQRDISAGYGMFFIKVNQLKIITGLRYEQTQRSYGANELVLDEQGEYVSTNPLTDSNSYANWFPGIHASLDMGRFSFIGSWSNTIERPEYAVIVPFRNIVREELYIEAGNPSLMPTLYTNYDFSIDYRLGSGNLFSLELFYQTVEDIVYHEVGLVPDGTYAGYELGTFRNGPSADLYGLRLIWSQELGKWLTFAEGLSLNAKYIYQESETIYPGRPGITLPLPERPGTQLELSLAYERYRIFIQLEVNFREASLDGINDEESWRDVYEAGHTYFNFTSSYEVADGVRLIFEVENLTSEEEGLEHYGNGILLTEYETSPRVFKFGFRFDI